MTNNFFTFNEYIRKAGSLLTPSMEDYLEMIYRLSLETGFIRIHELSQALNVQPPSVTKMVQKLSELGLVKYEKYSYIILTGEGKQIGLQLLERHKTVECFLRLIGVSASLLEETEKIEHIISGEAQKCISELTMFLIRNPDITERLTAFRAAQEGGGK